MLIQIIDDAADPTPGTIKSIAHSLAALPDVVIITSKVNAVFYMNSKSTSKIDLVCSVGSAAFQMLVAVDHSIIK